MTDEIDALRAENARLREALRVHADGLEVAASGDFEEAATDCGVTVGMVVQQEMRGQLRQLRRIHAALTPATSHE